jgi:hypothetical protein
LIIVGGCTTGAVVNSYKTRPYVTICQ